jgi:hypothetical protein
MDLYKKFARGYCAVEAKQFWPLPRPLSQISEMGSQSLTRANRHQLRRIALNFSRQQCTWSPGALSH